MSTGVNTLHDRRPDDIRRARTNRNADFFFENRNKTRRRVTVEEDSRMLLPNIAKRSVDGHTVKIAFLPRTRCQHTACQSTSW